MKRLILTFSIVCLAALIKPALATNDAGLPGEFLNVGVGGRPLGLAGAYTAVSDDIDALYWNPAGLSMYRSSQLEFQYSPLTIGGSYQYFAYSQPLYSLGNFGLGVVNLDSGKVPRTVPLFSGSDDFQEVGTFDHRETGYLASYAYRYGDHYASGLTMKMAEKSLDGTTKRGYGADWGNMFVVNDQLQFGLMIRNLLRPSYKYSSGTETFPTIARGGTAVKLFNNHLLTSLELEKTLGQPQNIKPHVGLEGHFIQNIFLRAGWDQTEITTGLGILFKNLQFDYAVGFQDIGMLNRFSVRVIFGGYEVDVRATPDVFSPVGLKNKVAFHVNTSHRDRVVKWVMSIRNAKGTVVRSLQGYDAPPAVLEWDGRNAQGRLVEAGDYTYRMAVTTNKNQTEMTPIRNLKIVSPTPIEIEAK